MLFMTILCQILLLLLVSCTPSSFADFQREGERISREISLELHEIETLPQLLHHETFLKDKFSRLTLLMIEARKFQREMGEEAEEFVSGEESLVLKRELLRIYAIEGGRDVIERCQSEALLKLDAFEKRFLK
jgi:hypothetical protein